MAKVLQHRRGTTAEHNNFTGAAGEITFDTTAKRLVAHDGVTKGGIPVAKKEEVDTSKSELQKAIDDAVAELRGNIAELGKHNVGDEWVSYTGVIPEGGVPYCGQEVTRATYADLWAYAQAQGLVKTESEWQAIASAQSGNVPYYSSGNGSTTFRMPKIVGYIRGANSQTEAGSHVHEGLPNITSQSTNGFGFNVWTAGDPRTIGAIGTQYDGYAPAGGDYGKFLSIDFDASRSSGVYGNSSHVTPETSTVLFGVYAYGVVVDAGELDAATLAQAVSKVEANLESRLPLNGGTISGLIVNAAGDIIRSNATDRWTSIKGGTSDDTGGFFTAYGKDSAGFGSATVGASDGTSRSEFSVRPSGRLEINGLDVAVIHSYGSDWVRFNNGFQICWGSMAGDTWISFQQPFADLTYSVTIAGVDSNDTWNATIYSDKTTSAIHMWARNVSKIEWTAIGRWK